MKVNQRFTVADSPDRVWHFLSNVRQVVTCVPGLELTDERDDGAYLGRFAVKVGPLSAKLDGEGTLSRDDADYSAKFEGKGIDKRGGSRAKGTMHYTVTSDPEGAAVEIQADFTLSGPLAQVGRTGIIEDVARALTQEFANNLVARLGAASGRSEAEASAAGIAAPPTQTRHFDAGFALSQSLWCRLLNFLKRLVGLGRKRRDVGSSN